MLKLGRYWPWKVYRATLKVLNLMMDFSQSTLIGTLKDTRSRQWGDSTSWCLKRKRKKYTLLPHKTKQVLGVADFEGWDLVENVISLAFVRLSTLFLSFSLFICLNGASVHSLPRVPEVVSRVRLGASFCRPKAEVTNGEAFRAGHLLRLTETGNRAWKASGTQCIHT